MTTIGSAVAEESPVVALLRRVRRGWAPPPELTISEFSAESIVLSSGPLAGTRWSNTFAPYQPGIMDAFHERGVEFVVVMGSSQWGKTSIAVNTVAYHIRHDPCRILVVEPNIDPMARDFSKNRLEPVIEASPALSEIFGEKRAKDASNTTLLKLFRGGFVAIGGANSASSLAARDVRLLVGDEIDRWPLELPGEGNTLSIAIKRTTAYRRRRRILLLSSPTLKNAPIHVWFERGDQRRFHVPCPKCGTLHPYEWKQVRWTDHDPTTARIHCPACDHPMTDAERIAVLKYGQWIADNPDRMDHTIVSFHLWEAYSPLSSLSEIVTAFLRARAAQKGGDPSEMHTWENTTLGEPVEPDKGDSVEPHVLFERREDYGDDIDLPEWGSCITMGVDVQDDRLVALVWGWGLGEECGLIDAHTLPGDTEQPEPWAMLDELLDREYRHPSGQRVPIYATCIDSGGHRTTLVYDYAARQAARRVYATIGRAGDRPIVSSPSPRKWGKNQRQIPLYTIGVDSAKSIWVSRFKVTEKGRGYVHLPRKDWCDQELLEQLTSEYKVRKFHKGYPIEVWVKRRAQNHGLDCSVLALGALRLLNPDLEQLAERLASPQSPAPSSPAPGGRQGWLGPRRSGWLRR